MLSGCFGGRLVLSTVGLAHSVRARINTDKVLIMGGKARNVYEISSGLNGDYEIWGGDNGQDAVILDSSAYYWSSTSVCYLENWDVQNPSDYSKYENFSETPIANTKNRFSKTDFPGLNDKTAYELSLNTCAIVTGKQIGRAHV